MNNISNSLRTAVKKENTAFNNEGRVGKQTDKLPQTTARLQSGRGDQCPGSILSDAHGEQKVNQAPSAKTRLVGKQVV